MVRLECSKCKAVFQDVIRVRKCPLCGNKEFKNAEPLIELRQFPKWFNHYDANVGFFYFRTIRADEGGEITAN